MKIMNLFKHLLVVAALALTLPACVKVNFNEDDGTTTGPVNGDDPNTTRILQGSYERNITLTGGTYTIKGYVYFTSGTAKQARCWATPRRAYRFASFRAFGRFSTNAAMESDRWRGMR